jgi:dTDP-4-dehydrorhamnose reductase
MSSRKVAVTGADGQLGRQLVAAFAQEGYEVLAAGRDRLDITSAEDLGELTKWSPGIVINAAAWTDVDGCARDPARARLVNGEAAGAVAAAAAAAGAVSIQISTNEVFDGEADTPYTEASSPNPVNPYGASKLLGEQAAAAANPDHLIIRTAWVFGPGGHNFPAKIVDVARRQSQLGAPLRVVTDELGNPTWAYDLAEGVLRAARLLMDGRLGPGFLHVAGDPPTSRYEWARTILSSVPEVSIVPISAADYARSSKVPLHAVLATDRARSLGIQPSDWRLATKQFAAELLQAA